MDLFEKAARAKFRFQTAKGEFNVEQLWDLNLTSRTSVDLDTVAKAVNNELKSVTEDSFVQTRSNPRKGELEDKLAIVKHIIQVKQDETKQRENRAVKLAQRQKLEEMLARKQDQAMEQLSIEAIQAQLESLKD